MTNEAEPKPPRRGGKPKYIPTPKDRTVVLNAKALLGLTQKDIASLLGIEEKTLRRHFRDVLDQAEAKVGIQVATAAYKQMIGAKAEFDANGKQIAAEIKPNPDMQKFYLARKWKWTENEPRPPQPIETNGLGTIDLSLCTDEELKILSVMFERLVKEEDKANGKKPQNPTH